MLRSEKNWVTQKLQPQQGSRQTKWQTKIEKQRDRERERGEESRVAQLLFIKQLSILLLDFSSELVPFPLYVNAFNNTLYIIIIIIIIIMYISNP